MPGLAAVAQRRFLERLTTPTASPANPANWFASADGLRDALFTFRDDLLGGISDPVIQARLKERAPIALIAFLFAAIIGLGLRGFAKSLLRHAVDGAEARERRLYIGVAAALARFLILGLVTGAILVGVNSLDVLGEAGDKLFKGVAFGIAQYISVYVLGATFFSPRASLMRLIQFQDREARSGYYGSVFLGAALFLEAVGNAFLAISDTATETQASVTFLVILIGAIGFTRISRVVACVCVRRGDTGALTFQLLVVIRRVLMAIAIAAPALALAGYEFAARFLFFPSAWTLVIIVTAYMMYRVVGEAVDIHIANDPDAQRRAAAAANAAEDESPQEGERLRLLPILVGLVLFFASLPLLALAWGASPADLAAAWRALSAGVLIGDVAISPVDFFVFILVFVAGYTITKAIQRVLKGSILPKAGMSVGGAEALASGFGYVGVIIASLIAIGAAGIDLSNLAIVAGALSVGIGFGLQNIVNNFVSGIILLIERPVKAGDWIEVGGVHGYVQKVNVRSTEIETFDRSSYILPNSDLISGPVTNYTLSDKVGRVIVPVHVSFDADSRLVEKILLEVGRAHPMVLRNPAPVAHFMKFGDSALEFDLRVMIRNVNWIFVVRSELNHEVLKRLKEAGIAIPYPQRDLHMRTIGPLGQAMTGERPDEPRPTVAHPRPE